MAINSWVEVSSVSSRVEVRLEQAVKKLRNDSVDGYFDMPESDLCE